jgi:predicted branched-subunit amino acid permease
MPKQTGALMRLAHHPLFWTGMRDIFGATLGTMSWAFMIGVAMVKSGMSPSEALLMHLLVYAGSAQLTTIPLIAAGAPILVIWLAAICVNLRFVVFSLHLREYWLSLPRLQRLLLGYLCNDFTYVLYIRRFTHPAATTRQRQAHIAYLIGSNSFNWLLWEICGIIGIFVGNAIPQRLGLEFAGTLALLALTTLLVTSKLRILTLILAAAAALLAWGLPWRLNIVVAIVVAVAMCLYLEPKMEKVEAARHA